MSHPDDGRTDPWAAVDCDERPSRTVIDLPNPASCTPDDVSTED